MENVEQDSQAGDYDEDEMDAKTVRKANVKTVMAALSEIGAPVSARDVVDHIAKKEKLDSGEIRGLVISVLRRGYNAGFLEKNGNEYVPVAMDATRRRRSRSRRGSSTSRSRSRRRSPRRSRSSRSRY